MRTSETTDRHEQLKNQRYNQALEKSKRRNHLLALITPETLVPPSHPNFLPPTPEQISALIKWSGLELQEVAEYLGFQAEQRSILSSWAKPFSQGTKGSTPKKAIPSPIWQYLTIILGLSPVPTIRRIEPPITTSKAFKINEKDVELTARIDYDANLIKIYITSENPMKNTGEPILQFDCAFGVNDDLDAILIAGRFRKDECPWEVDDEDGGNVLAKCINLFLKEEVWPAAWRLHDFYTLKPERFLRPQCLLSIYHKDFKLPTPTELMRFKRWLGYKSADLAEKVWMRSGSITYLSCSKASEKIDNLTVELASATDSKERHRLKILLRNEHLTPQAWYIMTSAAGLAPAIKVIGRTQGHRSAFDRMFVSKEVEGVPTEYWNITARKGWNESEKTTLYISFCIDSHKKKGKESTVYIPVTSDQGGQPQIMGRIFEEGAPDDWADLFMKYVPDDVGFLKETIRKWFTFVVWKKAWQEVWAGYETEATVDA